MVKGRVRLSQAEYFTFPKEKSEFHWILHKVKCHGELFLGWGCPICMGPAEARVLFGSLRTFSIYFALVHYNLKKFLLENGWFTMLC